MITRTFALSMTVFLLFCFPSKDGFGEESAGSATIEKGVHENDPRQLVTMPEQVRQLIRKDMLDHLAALNEILAYLGDQNLDAAAKVAENRMGKSSMGKHRATGVGPGRFMPPGMRNIGRGMHESASEFSQLVKRGDLKDAYAALQKVTASCVACHYSYRTQ